MNTATEITQNMSATGRTEQVYDEETGLITTTHKSGDFVVCNLSSINLPKAYMENSLERLINIQVEMLDNVIDVNNLPVAQASMTSRKYRNIGIGTYGWHHLLALKGIAWESQEAVDFADELYEDIAYYTIKASNNIAKERGAYPVYKGSEWDTGEYFERRGYFDGKNSERWKELYKNIQEHGVRNAQMMAVAPNMSTATIAGTTASIDPIFKAFYHEEKKDSKLPVVAPDLSHETYEFYQRSAYILDQRWSVRQNAARQKHIDQAISFNIYVPNTIKASILLDLHLQAWKSKMKTTYYVRSTASDIEGCEWCEG